MRLSQESELILLKRSAFSRTEPTVPVPPTFVSIAIADAPNHSDLPTVNVAPVEMLTRPVASIIVAPLLVAASVAPLLTVIEELVEAEPSGRVKVIGLLVPETRAMAAFGTFEAKASAVGVRAISRSACTTLPAFRARLSFAVNMTSAPLSGWLASLATVTVVAISVSVVRPFSVVRLPPINRLSALKEFNLVADNTIPEAPLLSLPTTVITGALKEAIPFRPDDDAAKLTEPLRLNAPPPVGRLNETLPPSIGISGSSVAINLLFKYSSAFLTAMLDFLSTTERGIT